MSAPAIRLDLPNPRLRLVDPLPCKNAPNGWNHRGANDAGNVMAERTTKATKVKKADTRTEAPANQDNYADNEISRARSDLRFWAIKHIKKRAEELNPNPDLNACISNSMRLADFHGRAHRLALKKSQDDGHRRSISLDGLEKLAAAWVEALESEVHDLDSGLYAVQQWVLAETERDLRRGLRAWKLLHENVGLLSLGITASRILRLGSDRSRSPRGERGRLVQRAVKFKPKTAGWWPSEPKDEDLAALSFLTFVGFDEFEHDFRNREQSAKSARGSENRRMGQESSQLQGFIHKEKKRCRNARKCLQ